MDIFPIKSTTNFITWDFVMSDIGFPKTDRRSDMLKHENRLCSIKSTPLLGTFRTEILFLYSGKLLGWFPVVFLTTYNSNFSVYGRQLDAKTKLNACIDKTQVKKSSCLLN